MSYQLKGHKDRNVVLSDDMLDIMRKYWNRASEIIYINIYFFPNPSGNQILLSNVNKVFRTGFSIFNQL